MKSLEFDRRAIRAAWWDVVKEELTAAECARVDAIDRARPFPDKSLAIEHPWRVYLCDGALRVLGIFPATTREEMKYMMVDRDVLIDGFGVEGDRPGDWRRQAALYAIDEITIYDYVATLPPLGLMLWLARYGDRNLVDWSAAGTS